MEIPEDLVLVGHVSGAYGIAGWVRIKPYSSDADALLSAKTWWLDKPDLHDVEMMQAKIHGEDVVAQLMGVADRNAAEALKGATVQIRRSHFPPLDDNEFYWIDLIGLAVENLQGEPLGTVSDLMDNGAHPILRVTVPGEAVADKAPREMLIPFVDQYVKTVDQAAKKVIVDWGLDY
ncbi:ribosome maturation factor RimM [Noviherbaspirillum massiliense]|uniref:ribosome maturation factor RimM n=1 Tax=Noviherbaspirillum massiliense TaxID=1465823 RepID=UPI00031C9AED|nr:ribosome maturation factor RimM [Noviherbaspirillum massiliense]